MKKIIAALLSAFLFIIIIFLTLQAPEETTALSRSVSDFLKKTGINLSSQQLRHLVHYPM